MNTSRLQFPISHRTVAKRFLGGPYIGLVMVDRLPVSVPLGKCYIDTATGFLTLITSPHIGPQSKGTV